MVGTRKILEWTGAGIFALSAAFVTPTAQAVIGATDNTPAATLLIPHFEVDLSNTSGRTTLLTISNTSATAVLNNIVLWSDQGIPAASFNIYLTGYDIQSLNLRDVLNGVLPRTASAGQDPANTISPKGNFSQDINFASCSSFLPYASVVANFPGPTPGPTPADVRAMLTGAASTVTYPGQCVGTAVGDNVARGYITIDTINQCTNLVPGNVGYNAGVVTFQNVMVADYFLVNSAANVEYSGSAAAIEASSVLPTPGTYTFYASRSNFDGTDGREALPTTWNFSPDNRGSELIIWRDPKVASAPHACGSAPTYGSLPIGDTNGLVGFGTFATPYAITAGTGVAPNVSQRVPYTAPPLTGVPTTKLGQIEFSLNHPGASLPTNDPAAAQSFVVLLRQPEGFPAFNLAIPGAPVDNARNAKHNHPPFSNP